MKALAFFPLAYIADVHGFALFAPYLVLFFGIALISRRAKRIRSMKVVPITIPIERTIERVGILPAR